MAIVSRKSKDKGLIADPGFPPGERKKFYSALSHLFRTPLVGAAGYVDYLMEGYSGALTPQQTSSIGQVRDSISRLERSVEIFLELAAFDLDLIHLSRQVLDVRLFFENLMPGFQEWADNEQIKLSVPLPERPFWIEADPEWLARLIREVLSNAIRVSPKGSLVTLDVQPKGKQLVFKVTDRGPGVSPAKLRWIFLPLAQLRTSQDPPSGDRGGLGLALAASIARLHGGRLQASHGPLGKGLAVSWGLPLARKPGLSASRVLVGAR